MSPEDIARRREGKRFNERIKLIATFMNNSGIAVLVGGLLLPYLGGRPVFSTASPLWIVAPVAFHGVGQLALTFIRSED